MPAATSTKKPTGPGYYDLIKEAVLTLKERQGSSRFAIDKYVSSKKGASYSKSRLNLALKRGVELGKLVAVKGSFKLAAEEKKAAAKKPAKKAAAKATTVGKKAVKKTKKVTKSAMKVSRKKPTATKKKVVKKSTAAAAKKAKKSKKPAAKKN